MSQRLRPKALRSNLAVSVVFKFDGRPIYRVTRKMVEFCSKWRFDTPQHVILNFAVGGIYPLKTNGIEQPYKGVPTETVERIRRGELAMEVDWVRVYKQASPDAER